MAAAVLNLVVSASTVIARAFSRSVASTSASSKPVETKSTEDARFEEDSSKLHRQSIDGAIPMAVCKYFEVLSTFQRYSGRTVSNLDSSKVMTNYVHVQVTTPLNQEPPNVLASLWPLEEKEEQGDGRIRRFHSTGTRRSAHLPSCYLYKSRGCGVRTYLPVCLPACLPVYVVFYLFIS